MAIRILFFCSTSVFALFFVALHPRLQPVAFMKLKYQTEIDNQKLSIKCPNGLSTLSEPTEAFRFSHNPIDLSIDFLPNMIYDQIVGIVIAYKDDLRKCSRCNASFFKTPDRLQNIWSNMSPENKTKMGYTDIAKGMLDGNDGFVALKSNGHIGLYEFEGANYQRSFKIALKLNE